MDHLNLSFLSGSKSSDVNLAFAFVREQEDEGDTLSVDVDHPAFYGTRTGTGAFRAPLPCLVDRGELTEDEYADQLAELNAEIAMTLSPPEPDDCYSARAERIDADEADEADLNLRRGGSWYAVGKVRTHRKMEGDRYVGRALFFRRTPEHLIEVRDSRPVLMCMF